MPLIPFQLHRRIPLVRRPFFQRDQAVAQRDRLAQENSDLRAKLTSTELRAPPGEKSLSDLRAAFLDPLIDLGTAEDPAFSGIVTPSPEFGQPKFGVNEVFLADAESYYARFQSFGYWRSLIAEAIRRTRCSDQPNLIVEFGCGFGNSTFPLLELFPDSRIIATDISPNLLSILRRLLDRRNITSDRCLTVAMDAQKPYIASEIADLVLGSAIMHHLADPGVFVAEAMRILRPGGAAVFFEPMEAGLAIVREACLRAAEEGERRGQSGPLTDAARNTARGLTGQILRDRQPGWRNQDDKWAFPQAVLETIAAAVGAELMVYPINNVEMPFRLQMAYILEANAGIPRETVPDWFWAPFDHFDKEVFSPSMLQSLPIEACIIFKKRGAAPAPMDRTILERGKPASLLRAWQTSSVVYGRFLREMSNKTASNGDRSAQPAFESWLEFNDLKEAGLSPYRPTFHFPGSFINLSHAALADAPLGRMGLDFLIDIGIDGYLAREDALKLYEMAFYSDGDILELGTHRGLSTSILALALADARSSATLETVDIDGVTQALARETLSFRAGFDRTKFSVMDATQRVLELTKQDRRFGFVFVDHWHGYDATLEVATQLNRLLTPGGFALFHDCINGSNADPEHVYGVYQAVLDALAADENFIFFGNFGCCSLWRRLAAQRPTT